MKKRKLMSLLLVLAMAVGLVSGCGVGSKEEAGETSEQEESGAKNTVVYGTPTAPAGTFNPVIAFMGTDNRVDELVYASLLQTKPDGSLEGYLAEDYQVDGNTITFTVRDGVKWQDGEDFTMDDIVFTLESVAKTDDDFSKVSSIAGAQEFKDGTADSISGLTVSGNKITMELSETYAPSLTQVGTLGIIPKHIWEEVPFEEWEENTELLNNPVGCGPYQIAEYNPGESVEFTAFEDFFDGKPAIDNFVIKVVNADAIVAELTSGNIDFVDVKELNSTEVDELEEEGFTRYSIADEMYQYISFNMRLPIFQDKNLRQAMTYTIDREAILANIVEGRGTLLNAPFIPGGWADPDVSELNTYDYNEEKAIELLEESGWTDADGDGIRENADGEKLQFTLRCSNDSKTREKAVLYVKECLAKVGIDVEVSVEEDGVMAEDCIYNHNYEMYALNCYFGEDPDPYFWWHSDSASDEPGTASFNFGSYKNDLVDANIIAGQQTMDQEERSALYLDVAKQINEDAPMIFLYVQNREIMCNSNLEGFDPGTFNLFYNVANWTFAE